MLDKTQIQIIKNRISKGKKLSQKWVNKHPELQMDRGVWVPGGQWNKEEWDPELPDWEPAVDEYLGVWPEDDGVLVNGNDLATLVGLTEGIAQNSDVP